MPKSDWMEQAMAGAWVECEIAVLPRSGESFPLVMRTATGEVHGVLRLAVDTASLRPLLSPTAVTSDTGRRLFHALFNDATLERYTQLQQERQPEQTLRLRLELPPNEADLAALPWELLDDPERGALVLHTPLTRYLPSKGNDSVPVANAPLKVLLCSGAADEASAQQLAALEKALRGLGRGFLSLTVEANVSSAKLQRLLRQGFHACQIIGAVSQANDGRTARLQLGGEWVKAQQLASWLARSELRLAVLSGHPDQSADEGTVAAFGSALAEAGRAAVIAEPLAIPESAAFAATCYRGLAEGLPLDQCVLEARRAVAAGSATERLDWSRPRLWLRIADGQLWQLPALLPALLPQSVTFPPAATAIGARLAMSLDCGVLLTAPAPVTITRRTAPPELPTAPLGFRDREALLTTLQSEQSAWLHGPPGSGVSSLLRVAATRLHESFADGVIYLPNGLPTAGMLETLRQLFARLYHSDGIALPQATIETLLRQLRVLVILDRPALAASELSTLTDLLEHGALLIGAEEAAPSRLRDLPMAGLPRDEAVVLFAAELGIAAGLTGFELLPRMSAALDDLPLPLVLLGRLVRSGAVTLPRLAALLDAQFSRPTAGEPPSALVLALRLVLPQLNPAESNVLSLLTQSAAPLPIEVLAELSQLSVSATRAALKRLVALRLVSGDERYAVDGTSLRRALAASLPEADEATRLATWFAQAATEHRSDFAWLEGELPNLLAAIPILLESDAAAAGRLARIVSPLLALSGRWDSWTRVLEWAGRAADATHNRALRAWALHERGTLAGLLGDRTAARELLTSALRLREQQQDATGIATTRHNLSFLALLPAADSSLAEEKEAATEAPKRPWLWWVVPIVILLVLIGTGFAVARGVPPVILSSSPAPTVSPITTLVPVSSPVPPLPTATPALAPTAIPTLPTASAVVPVVSCQVIVSNLNMRNGPSVQYTVIQTLSNGTTMEPLARNEDGSWIEVALSNSQQRGWISALESLLRCDADLAALPLGEIPALPPATRRPVIATVIPPTLEPATAEPPSPDATTVESIPSEGTTAEPVAPVASTTSPSE